MTKTEVKQEVEKLLKANSLCPEGREAVQAYLEAYGTADEKSKAEALLQELEEDITSIDDLIAFAGSEHGRQIFGEEKAAAILKAAKEAKEKGEETCICEACQIAKVILANRTALLS
ncbi:hypothetical protein [Oribacterium sp. oral taxon 108]|uniref:hypothetical protein n=1 Tax=Oribacterium sp. oral taxon 108 TaxID=712414 RepID=UPI00020DDEBC|nr:hypothetical protein [Oribacterium sp. oral taxon 108]EGL37905.1 hypothetical protein HMPREF9124_2068 [Oribacterium sp. oral taxon 108 str. F0425]